MRQKNFSENCPKFGHAPSPRPPQTLKNIGCKGLQNITGLGPTLVVIIPNTSECTGLPPSGPDLARICASRGVAGPDHIDLWPADRETCNMHLLRFPQQAYCCCIDHINTHATKNTTRWGNAWENKRSSRSKVNFECHAESRQIRCGYKMRSCCFLIHLPLYTPRKVTQVPTSQKTHCISVTITKNVPV